MPSNNTIKRRPSDRVKMAGEYSRYVPAHQLKGVHAPVFMIESCASTMDEAWNLVDEAMFPEWASVLAVHQWAGRGQHRKTWHSPRGNLYASVRLPRTARRWEPLLPLLVGGLLLDYLKSLGLHVELKWPNDLLVHRKKVGGILLEEKNGIVIAGVGLNLKSAPGAQDLAPSHSLPAACLRQFNVDLTPLALWTAIMEKAVPWFKNVLTRSTPADFVSTIEDNLAFVGEKVLVQERNSEFPAVLVGLDAAGALKIRPSAGLQTLQSGSIYPVIF